ncbi:MAG: nickel pincer cofactor biosynthesis protein LarC [candidate division Zixibacteria bacterium]
MKTAYFDCFSGVAGDMIIGALLDAGLPFDKFKSEIEKLRLTGYELKSERVTKNHISGTKFTVELTEKQPHRKPGEIIAIIENSGLDKEIKINSIKIFNRLARAEAAAHGESMENVHFHEVGAVDAIIDICGAVIGLEMMGIEKVYSSSISLGTGNIKTEHGLMPVPSPATTELVRSVSVRLTDIESELTTPTGAAILTTIAEFSKPEGLSIENTGYGAGSRDLPGLPNLLRVFTGEIYEKLESDRITVMETNLDRATPEMIGQLIDDALAGGALDVFITPILMKKNRPGHLLTLLCELEKKDKLAKMVFTRGLTLGIRIREISRMKLKRKELKITTSGGEVAVKVGSFDGTSILLPEFDDMAEAMRQSGKSYDDIYFEIKQSMGKEI